MSVLASQTGISIGVVGDLPEVRAPALRHARTAGEALAQLLAETGFVAIQVGPVAWRIERAHPPARRPASSVTAQPEPAQEQTIVVTATKDGATRFAVPQAVSVLRLAKGDRHDPTRDTAYVAGEVEGLNLTALGPGRNRLFLRGVADSPFNDANQSPVAVVLDETRLTYSAPDPDLRLIDVERVELLKGPQGALYGLGTLGGVYHVVTTRADLTHFSGSISAGTEFIVHGTLGESGAAVVNVPIVSERVGLRLVGYESREPGWIDTANRQNGNSTRVGGGRASLGVVLDGGWRVDLGAIRQRLNTSDSQYTYAIGSFARPLQLAEPHDNDFDHFSMRVGGTLGNVKVQLLAGHTVHEVDDSFDATVGATGFGVANPRVFEDARTYRLTDAELRVNGPLGKLTWLLGLAHATAHEYGTRTLSSSPSNAPVVIDTSSRMTQETGLFGKLDVPLADKLIVEIGGRLYHSVQQGDFSGGNQALTQTSSRWALTPTAAVSWRAKANRLIYLHYGTAYRPGVMDFSWRGKVRQLVGDSVRTLEAGWRESFADGGDFEADGFVTWWSNIQSDHLLPNGLIAAHNAGDARIVGAEVTLNLPLQRGWYISTGASVQDAEIVNTNPAIPATHANLPAIPTLTLRGSITHNVQLRSLAASVKLSLRYVGPANLSFDPTLNRSMGQVLESRLDAGLDWGRTRIDLRLSNLLNRLDNRFAYGNPFRLGTPQYTPQRPFDASLAITRTF